MSSTVLILIVNLVLLFFVLIGFLIGLKRGVKKQALWLAFFTVAIILAFVFTPLITNKVIDIKINIDGSLVSIRDYILSYITNNQVVGGLYVEGSSFAGVLDNFPVMIANLAVFILCLYSFLFVLWIIYMIVATIIFKHKKNKALDGKVYTIKQGQAVELIDVKPKKYRVAGGLLGVLTGFFLCFFTLLPISGIVSIYSDATNVEVALAEENQNQSAVKNLIDDYIPNEYQEYLKAYDKTIINFLGGLVGFDDFCFNELASITVDGNKIALKNEIITYAEIYDTVEFFIGIDFNNTVWKNFDFVRLNKAVDLIFESQLFRTLSSEIIPYALEYVQNNNSFNNDEINSAVKELCYALEVGFEDNYEAELLKADFKAIVRSFETLCVSGITDEIFQETVNLNLILDTLVADDCKNLNDILNNFFASTSVKSLMVGAINIGLEKLEKSLPESANLDRIDITKVNWSQFRNEVNSVVQSGVKVYDVLKNSQYNFEDIVDNPVKVYDMNYEVLVGEGFKILDVLSTSNVFVNTVNHTNIYDNLLNAVQNTNLGKYVNTQAFKSSENFSWANESNVIVGLLNKTKPIVQNETSFKDVDYTSLKASVNAFFDSKFVDAVNLDFLDNVFDSVENIENQDVKNLVNVLVKEVQSKDSLNELKTDALNIFDIFEICGKSEIIDQIKSGHINFVEVVTALGVKDSDVPRYENLIDKFFSSTLLKNLLTNSINVILGSIENGINTTLNRVEEKTSEWTEWNSLKNGLTGLFEELSAVVKAYEGKELTFDIDMLDESFVSCIENFSSALDYFATLPIWSYQNQDGTSGNVYNDIISALEKNEELSPYIDFSCAKLDNFVDGKLWSVELPSYKMSFERMLDKNITIDGTSTNLLQAILNGKDLTEIIKTFTTTDVQDGNNVIKSDVETILLPILEGKLLKKIAVNIINEINFQIEKITDASVTEETSTLNKITIDFNISAQSQDILKVVKEIVEYLKLTNPEISELESLLNALEINATKQYGQDYGVFKQAYELLENYVNNQVKTSIENELGLNEGVLTDVGNISISTLIEIADTTKDVLNKIDDGTLNAEDAKKLVDVFSNNEAQELVGTIAREGATITVSEEIQQELNNYVNEQITDENLLNNLKSIFGLIGE